MDSIDIWLLDKKQLLPLHQNWRNILSAEEQQRADRFHFAQDKESFTLFHACKRLILAHYLNKPPLKIAILTGEKGKPFLKDTRVTFNLSHTKEMAIVAVTLEAEIGVDIEKIKDMEDYLTIAKRFFHLDEYHCLKSINNPQQRQEAFFLLWTAKEAIVKATGEGIAAGLDTFCITIDKQNNNSLASNYPNKNTLLRLQVPAGYIASVAALNQTTSIIYQDFSSLISIST